MYFGAVTGGKNGILGPAQAAATHVFRTHSITFTRNDVYMTSIYSFPYLALFGLNWPYLDLFGLI